MRKTIREKISEVFDLGKYKDFCAEIGKVIIGLENPRDFISAALLFGGHVLIDGPPGYAKTRLVNAIAMGTNMKFTKAQLSGDQTSDALKGYEMLVPNITVQSADSGISEKIAREDFISNARTLVREGPLAGAQFFLFDEVSRANEEVPNSLFSAMQEGEFSIGDKKFPMDFLFTIAATRNVFESSGIRPLSFAFLDRFSLSVVIPRPSAKEEEKIANLSSEVDFGKIIKKVWDKDQITRLRTFFQSEKLFSDDSPILAYITRLVRATDPHLNENKEFVEEIEKMEGRKVDIGGSPRATQWLARLTAVYVYCILQEKTILPEHVQSLVKQVLRHRLVFKNIKEGESIIRAEELIDKILKRTPIL